MDESDRLVETHLPLQHLLPTHDHHTPILIHLDVGGSFGLHSPRLGLALLVAALPDVVVLLEMQVFFVGGLVFVHDDGDLVVCLPQGLMGGRFRPFVGGHGSGVRRGGRKQLFLHVGQFFHFFYGNSAGLVDLQAGNDELLQIS